MLLKKHLEGVNTLEEYKKDLKTIDSVERRLGIIGEALHKAVKTDNALPITDKPKIIRLRHIIVHDYDLVNSATIREIITVHLPVLKKEVEALLNDN